MKPEPPVDEPRREKENMDEPQEEFIEDSAPNSRPKENEPAKKPSGHEQD